MRYAGAEAPATAFLIEKKQKVGVTSAFLFSLKPLFVFAKSPAKDLERPQDAPKSLPIFRRIRKKGPKALPLQKRVPGITPGDSFCLR